MAAGWAQLLALANKMKLPREEYLVAQKLYRGWSLLGTVVLTALISTAVLAILEYGNGTPSHLVLAASGCIAVS